MHTDSVQSVPSQFERNNPTHPLRVMFLITSMHVGGAEMLLVNLMRRFDPKRIVPSIGCLKEPGELGQQLENEFEVHSHLIAHKYDVGVVWRLKRLFEQRKIDAVVTVGAGDKMFWGRLAARRARVPVILSALHSTGWPDEIGRLNRWLTPITDGFIAVAEPHRQYLVDVEELPDNKVCLIPNGIDTEHFGFDADKRSVWRERLSISDDSPVCGIVAALRPEKNHEMFMRVAETVGRQLEAAHFMIVGGGQSYQLLMKYARSLTCRDRIHFVGNSRDIPGALSAMDLFSLTSHNEASPVSILEAMSVGLPIVAPRVGSIDQAVLHGKTGFLLPAGDENQFAEHWLRLLRDPRLRSEMGRAARQHVIEYGSLDRMTEGYTRLIEEVFLNKRPNEVQERRTPAEPVIDIEPEECTTLHSSHSTFS